MLWAMGVAAAAFDVASALTTASTSAPAGKGGFSLDGTEDASTAVAMGTGSGGSLSSGTLSALIGATGQANSAQKSQLQVLLDQFDRDGSGLVSRGEFASGLGADEATVADTFGALDRNGDGSLGADELSVLLGNSLPSAVVATTESSPATGGTEAALQPSTGGLESPPVMTGSLEPVAPTTGGAEAQSPAETGGRELLADSVNFSPELASYSLMQQLMETGFAGAGAPSLSMSI